jgi:type II secretory pathway component PulM
MDTQMKSRSELQSDYEHHDGQRKIWKFFFIASVVAIVFYALTSNDDNIQMGIIVGLCSAGLWGALWSGSVNYLQRIKEELNNN